MNGTVDPNTTSNVVVTKKNNTRIIELIFQAQKSKITEIVKKKIS